MISAGYPGKAASTILVRRGVAFFAALAGAFITTLIVAAPSPADEPPDPSSLIPSAFLRLPADSSDYVIMVDKAAQKVRVYRTADLSTPIKVYPCSTGENGGAKQRRNDRKTPEGVYFFTGSYGEKELAPIYGTRAFPLDYPNPLDEKEGRKGYGIWFHGTNKPLKPRDSNGCIAMENKDIDDLASYIELKKTPVVICSRLELVSPARLKREAESLEALIERWRRTWEGKDIERYMSCYSRSFQSGGKGWDDWRQYKADLARTYGPITVETDNLLMLRSNGAILARFDQRYRTSALHSEGKKNLYFKQNSAEWKIVCEFFEGRDITMSAEEGSPPGQLEKVRDLVLFWRNAWQEQDLESYISCYDKHFRSRGMDLEAWKRHRRRLNARHRSVEVEIRDIKISPKSATEAHVGFIQDYRADDYHDRGYKNLYLIKKGEDWKIRKEKWKPL